MARPKYSLKLMLFESVAIAFCANTNLCGLVLDNRCFESFSKYNHSFAQAPNTFRKFYYNMNGSVIVFKILSFGDYIKFYGLPKECLFVSYSDWKTKSVVFFRNNKSFRNLLCFKPSRVVKKASGVCLPCQSVLYCRSFFATISQFVG